MIGRMILITFFLLSLVFLSPGCSGSVAHLDQAELESEAARKAAMLVKEGQPDKAVQVLQEAIESGPRMARLHLELAIVLHESQKDYLGAAYHYRKYLELRPDTQKRSLIENRMKTAQQLLAAGVAGTAKTAAAAALLELKKENADLLARNLQLEDQLRAAKPLYREAMRSREASNTVSGTAGPAEADQNSGFRRYAVQGGDSLSSIAVKFYKDASRWDQIYEANRKELENSNDLKIGQMLIIP